MPKFYRNLIRRGEYKIASYVLCSHFLIKNPWRIWVATCHILQPAVAQAAIYHYKGEVAANGRDNEEYHPRALI